MSPASETRMDERTLRRAASSDRLKNRISINAKCQKVDFNEWIAGHLEGLAYGTGLELCCGTGAQTRLLLKRFPGERLFALDIAPDVVRGLAEEYAGLEKPHVRFLATDIDNAPEVLEGEGVTPGTLDLAFCSYGLYYSKDAALLLERLAGLLSPCGEVCIVGPFGANNTQLFGLLEAAGVRVEQPVRFSCGGFMTEVVLPHMAHRYERVDVRTMVNEIVWTSEADLMAYWKGSIFHDEAREQAVRALVREHFAANGTFVNEKHVMLARATGKKPDGTCAGKA